MPWVDLGASWRFPDSVRGPRPGAAQSFFREVPVSPPSLRMRINEAQERGATATASPCVGAIVSRVLEGDRDAFRLLVERHYGAVFGLCRRLLGGRETDAEEVAQETFVSAFKYLPTLEDLNRFGAWLFQIARSICRDRRRRWRAEERALAVRSELLRRQSLDADRDGGGGSVSSAIADLPPAEREVLMLKYFDGLSYEEIAQRLNISFSQVDHWIRKARERLSRRLRVRLRRETE